jgi:AcrR family transcriptional regulator
VEPFFHPDSYGYRPGRSALDAVGVCRERCWKYDWVIDLDYQSFFDSLDHELVLRAVAAHTDKRWVLLYVERWLKAPIQQEDGAVAARDRGTPQGSAISPVLANVFLHYACDLWMNREFPAVPFERYADDIVTHCQSERQARVVLDAITQRMASLGLELNPGKTRIVYCKDSKRKGSYEHEQFDFLGYTFRPRTAREACFLAAFETAVDRVSRYVLDRYDPKVRWAERLRAALSALLAFLDVEPEAGWLLIVGSPGAGQRALEQRRLVLEQMIAFVDEGRQASKNSGDPPPLTAEGLAGGVLALIHARMLDEHPAPLTELLPALMAMVVLPYLGPAAARRELARPAPPARNGRHPPSAHPLRELDMRLTYRTIRVLLAIGAGGRESDPRGSHPSNRQVADAAGIRDQGQVSKLLTRLQQLGLIRNACDPRTKGEPNAWVLTERGVEVREALSV